MVIYFCIIILTKNENKQAIILQHTFFAFQWKLFYVRWRFWYVNTQFPTNCSLYSNCQLMSMETFLNLHWDIEYSLKIENIQLDQVCLFPGKVKY